MTGSDLINMGIPQGPIVGLALRLIPEAAKKRPVLHFGNPVELRAVAKSEHQQTGIASYLPPSLARGKWLAVAENVPGLRPPPELPTCRRARCRGRPGGRE